VTHPKIVRGSREGCQGCRHVAPAGYSTTFVNDLPSRAPPTLNCRCRMKRQRLPRAIFSARFGVAQPCTTTPPLPPTRRSSVPPCPACPLPLATSFRRSVLCACGGLKQRAAADPPYPPRAQAADPNDLLAAIRGAGLKALHHTVEPVGATCSFGHVAHVLAHVLTRARRWPQKRQRRTISEANWRRRFLGLGCICALHRDFHTHTRSRPTATAPTRATHAPIMSLRSRTNRG
jgi:hypothetical protein